MGAVELFRPFLAPSFAWVSVVPKSVCLQTPVMLRLCLSFLLLQIGKGPLVFSCEEFDEKKKQLRLFTDAMAEEGRAAIGGWLRHESGSRELSS
eukprot:7547445-Karenia_brevis.AAC.1